MANPNCALCGHPKDAHHEGKVRPCFVLVHLNGQGYRCVCTDFVKRVKAPAASASQTPEAK